jgi:glycosyltransferase involved in cell wall biosynthesis
MVLGIDASRYQNDEATGVEWYSFHLLNELIPLLGREHNVSVKLFSPKDFDLKTEAPFNVKKRIIKQRRLWTLIRLSLELFFNKVDMLFVPSHTLPFYFPKKSIITIHDVAFIKHPEFYSAIEKWKLQRATKTAIKKAWKIIVPSEATKDDLIKYYNCCEDKIFVIYHGAPQFSKLVRWLPEEKKQLLSQFHLKESDLYVLYVGRLEAKKNIVNLIDGFSRLCREFPDWKLVLAGKRGKGFEDIWQKIVDLKLQDNVILPGYITEKEKIFLLSGCRIFAYPSLYEGFGLPILEAFASRRPVLTSKITSMPEIAGDAAYLVDPANTVEIGVGLKRLASDGVLVNQLINKGDKRLEYFSWEKAARETYDVLFN